jgi:hypothetical protein
MEREVRKREGRKMVKYEEISERNVRLSMRVMRKMVILRVMRKNG